MNLKLQNRHRYIWTGIALFLPILFVAAYSVIPPSVAYTFKPNPNQDYSGYDITPLIDNEQFKLQYVDSRGDTILPYQTLEFYLKEPLTNPSNVIYISKDETIENGLILGNLNNTTKYQFKIDKTDIPIHPYVILYDALHRETIFVEQLNLPITNN